MNSENTYDHPELVVDSDVSASYLKLNSTLSHKVHQTVDINDTVLIDFDEDGVILGIEFLDNIFTVEQLRNKFKKTGVVVTSVS
jgi:uncharacterized protein YuzE